MPSPMDLARIENAIKAAIAALERPYIKGVHSYGGEFDGELANVVSRFPAVWVTWGGSGKPRKFTNCERWIRPHVFVVLVGARSVRSEESSRHGDMNAAGTFQLLADLDCALLGQDLAEIDPDLNIDAFQPGSIRTLFNVTRAGGDAVSVIAYEWHTRSVIEKLAPEDRWLTSIGMDFVLEPGDETTDLDAVLDLWADGGAFPDGMAEPDGTEEPR